MGGAHPPAGDALVDATTGRRMSWAGLEERVSRLSRTASVGPGGEGLGLRQGDRVAILAKNRIEVQELYFAAARAGLVDDAAQLAARARRARSYPGVRRPEGADHVTAQLRGHSSKELQTRGVDLPHWLELVAEKDGASSYEDLLAASSARRPPWSAKVGDDDPFFILYTGGTTGTSKGALHSHNSAFSA